MHKTILTCVSAAVAATIVLAILRARSAGPSAASAAEQQWKIHDRSRPQPPVITPGESSTQDRPGRPPSDAIVLFGGADLSKWQAADGGPAKWKVGDGYFEVAPGTGDMQTRDAFGDSQLHVEWATPSPARGEDQDRGNSGVFLHGLYEVQVLDSYQSKTYADGQAAAIYGQYPPLVNPCRPPGEWQTYDIVFEAPKFEGDKLVKPAYVTVFHNGVIMHNRQEITGRTPHARVGTYAAHGPEEPLQLQNHGSKVRFRNIWVRRLGGYDEPEKK